MAGLTGKTPAATYKDLLKIENSNAGIDDTLRQVQDGTGDGSALYIETNSVKIKPEADDTALLDIHDKDGNSKFKVDTSNDLVTAIGHYTNTQYAYFGTTSTDAIPSAGSTHTAVPFGNLFGSNAEVTFGTGTNPATSLTISTTADDLLGVIWYVPDNITVDAVHVWVAGSAASGDTLKFHLMKYDIVSADGSTCGDLSNGTVVADGADITHDGYEQADYQSMTIQSANVDSGEAVLLMIHSNGTNSDYSINATVKYHLR